MRSVRVVAMVACVLGACSSSRDELPDTGPSWDWDGGLLGPRMGSGMGVPDGGGTVAYDASVCADGGHLTSSYTCDPLDPTACGPGATCLPYLDATDGVCAAGTFGTTCFAAGSAGEGAPCALGSECAPGTWCIESPSGSWCERICRQSETRCPDGRVCFPVDTRTDYGACG